MTVGPSVKIPCVVDATGTAGEFKFPAEWGGSSMQCRDPVPCLADFPVPPYHSGLVVSDIYIVSASQYVSYLCCCLSLLPQLGCNILATWGPFFWRPRYSNFTIHIF